MNYLMSTTFPTRSLFSEFMEGIQDLQESRFYSFSPRIDVEEKNEMIVVRTEIPGVKKEDLKVVLENGILVIEGEKKNTSKDSEVKRNEISYGKFKRALLIGEDWNADKIKAECIDGVLIITAEKKEESKPKSVKIL
jgi:HSP20 family protein